MVKIILRLEAIMIFGISLLCYSTLDTSWLMFVALWILPDISMVGYLINKKVGSIVYNLVHNYLPAAFVVLVGFLSQYDLVMAFGIAYISHVALDRALGFGLKYPTGFKQTHLQKI